MGVGEEQGKMPGSRYVKHTVHMSENVTVKSIIMCNQHKIKTLKAHISQRALLEPNCL